MNRAFRFIFTFSQIGRIFIAAAFILLNIIFLSNESVNAQIDPTFGTNGAVTAELGSEDATVASFVLPDGKILVVSVATSGLRQLTYFIRYNSDGTPDSTYGTNGILQIGIPYFFPDRGEILGATRQPDGKIVLVGYDYFDSNLRGLVARYNEDGTIDTSFAGGGGISRPDLASFGDDRFYSVVIQPDGKILIAGGSRVGGHYPSLALMRYHSNGSVDTSMGTSNNGFIIHNTTGNFPNLEGAEFLYLQSTGKIIVGSLRETTSSGSDNSRGRVRRFNANGTIDSSFTVLNFTGFDEFQTVFVQPDDKILVGARVSKTDTLERVHFNSLITRYTPDGSIDTSFGNAGQISIDVANYQFDSPKGFQVMPDGQILVAVHTGVGINRTSYRGNYLALVRLSPTGAINGKFLVAPASDNLKSVITILPDGKILTTVIGRYWSGAFGVMLVRAVGVPLQNYLFQSFPFIRAGSSVTPATFRPSDSSWRFYPSTGGSWGFSDDIPVFADYIGGYTSEPAFFRPSEGKWYISRNHQDPSIDFFVVRWGQAGDVPVPADYNGDGKSDVAVFRPSNGTWYINYMAEGSYTIHQWGLSGDKPVAGDYDGDGKFDIAVYRPSDGNWYIQRSSDGGYTIVHFGLDGDIPVQEDYDGDGKFDIAVYRPSTGVWYILKSSDGSFFAIQWGLAGDIPVPGNYDNDLKINIAVFRPSNAGWYILNPDYNSMHNYTWGASGDIPLPAKF